MPDPVQAAVEEHLAAERAKDYEAARQRDAEKARVIVEEGLRRPAPNPEALTRVTEEGSGGQAGDSRLGSRLRKRERDEARGIQGRPPYA